MPPSPLPPAFVALLNRQLGTFTRNQALANGVTEDRLRANVAAQRWRSIDRGRATYTAFTGPLTPEHREWLAVLTAGPAAALSHETAAHRHGLLREPPPVIHVLVPYARSPGHAPGVRIHRTRSPRRLAGTPPTTSVADTLCDLAAGGWRADQLAGIVSAAVRRRLTDESDLLAAMDSRGPFRNVAALRSLAHDTGSGAESALELRFLNDVERAHGLPRAQRQARVRRRDGSTAIRDVYYRRFGVVVELDGREFHASMRARLADGRRDRLAADDRELTLRYGWLDVAETACLVAREVAAVLRGRGWSGSPRACPSCEGMPWP